MLVRRMSTYVPSRSATHFFSFPSRRAYYHSHRIIDNASPNYISSLPISHQCQIVKLSNLISPPQNKTHLSTCSVDSLLILPIFTHLHNCTICQLLCYSFYCRALQCTRTYCNIHNSIFPLIIYHLQNVLGQFLTR